MGEYIVKIQGFLSRKSIWVQWVGMVDYWEWNFGTQKLNEIIVGIIES